MVNGLYEKGRGWRHKQRVNKLNNSSTQVAYRCSMQTLNKAFDNTESTTLMVDLDVAIMIKVLHHGSCF